MEARIYKALLNGKETPDSYTIWLRPTKQAARRGVTISAYCCNVIGGQVWGYWLDFDSNTRIGLDVNLGKRQKLDAVPTAIRRHAARLEKVWNKACITDNWDAWNAI